MDPKYIRIALVLPDGQILDSDAMSGVEEWRVARWYDARGREVLQPLLFGVLDKRVGDSDDIHLHWHACGDCGGEWLDTLFRSVPHVDRVLFCSS